jgi:hypothetical protein
VGRAALLAQLDSATDRGTCRTLGRGDRRAGDGQARGARGLAGAPHLFLVTHRALRDVPRGCAVWAGLVARMAPYFGGG